MAVGKQNAYIWHGRENSSGNDRKSCKKVSGEKTCLKKSQDKMSLQIKSRALDSSDFFSLNSMEAVNKVLRSLRKYIRRKKFLNLVKMRIKSEAFS